MIKRAIIIGAGIAGLKAAVELVKLGYEIDIFEAKSNVGGRCFSMTDTVSGDEIDNGQHLFAAVYSEFFELLKDLGAEHLVYPQEKLEIDFYDKSGKYSLRTGYLPTKLGLLQAMLSYGALDFRSKCIIISFIAKIPQLNPTQFKSALDLLIYCKQTDRAIKYLWEPLILATMNQSVAKSSAQIFYNVVSKLFASSKSSKLYFSKVGLGRLFDNFEKFIASKGKNRLHLNGQIKEIIIENNEAKGAVTLSGERFYADCVISAIPPKNLKNLLDASNAKNIAIHPFDYSPIISYYYWTDSEATNARISGLIGTQSQWLFNRRAIAESNSQNYPHHYTVTISNADELAKLSHEDIEKIIIDDLKLCGLMRDEKILHSRLIVDKRATVSLDFSNEEHRPQAAAAIKSLYIAGDWTSTKLPATIEGAAASGKKVAEILKKYF